MTDDTIPGGGGVTDGTQFSDEQARVTFDMLLGLRRMAEERPEAAEDHAEFAAKAAGLLVRGILGWAAEALGLLYDADEARRPPVEEARGIVARTLELGLPVMQPSANSYLVLALRALNAGQVDPLLRPSKVARRRARPYDTARAELSILMWVRWQHGLGRLVKDAEREVAEAVKEEQSTVKKWPQGLKRVFGEEHVAWALGCAERLGQVEAAHKAEAKEEPLRLDGDLLWAFHHTPRSLDGVVALRKRGMGKRREEKPGGRQGNYRVR